MGLGRWAESRPICEAAIDCATRRPTPSSRRAGTVDARLGPRRAGGDRGGPRASSARRGPLPVGGAERALGRDGPQPRAEPARDRPSRGGARRRHRDAGRPRAGGLERRYGMELAALVSDVLLGQGRWDEADRATRRGSRSTSAVVGRRISRSSGRGSSLVAAMRPTRPDRLEAIDRTRLEPDLAVLHAIVVGRGGLIEGGRTPRSMRSIEGSKRCSDPATASGATPLRRARAPGGRRTRRDASARTATSRVSPRSWSRAAPLRAAAEVLADRRGHRDRPGVARLGGGRGRSARRARLGPGIVGTGRRRLGSEAGRSRRARLGPLPAWPSRSSGDRA